MDKAVIVIADDEPHIRQVIAMKLAKGGYEIQQSADGEEAFDLCQTFRPSLLITDYQMPCMSGLELCQKLQTVPDMVGMPILMLTARGFDLSEQQQQQAGITRLMSKPFSPSELLRVVHQMVGTVVKR